MFNSMMYLPSNKLVDWIKVYWFLQGSGNGENFDKQYILPDGCATIVIVLEGQMLLETYSKCTLKKGIHIIPPTLQAHNDLISDDIYLIDIQLNPGIFYQLFGLPVEKLDDTIYSLEDLSIKMSDDLLEKITFYKDNRFMMINELDKFFTKLFVNRQFEANKLLYGIQKLYQNANLELFYEEQDLSKRQVQRKVKAITGLTPKSISQMGRFYNILENMKNNRMNIDFSDLALTNMYVDQSHFIKDFKAFSKCTPKQFLVEQENYLQYKAIKKNEVYDYLIC